ncbi:MAG: hypothetical protein ACRD0Z_12290 [Acidimicrobiales bacterium]
MIVVHFQLAWRETADCLRRETVRGRPYHSVAVLAALSIAGAVYEFHRNPTAAALLTFIGALLAMGLFQLTVTLPNRAWRTNPWMQGLQSFAFSETGVQWKRVYTASSVQWAAFSDITEIAAGYVFKQGSPRRLIIAIIPRRAFASYGDKMYFRHMASRHVPVTFRPDPPPPAGS